jgi:hypothetical protein
VGIVRGVLLTGVYGTGKTSVAVEMADILERLGEPYAVLDLDWLLWFQSASGDVDAHAMMLRNLAPIVANYQQVGVRTFVLARSIASREELESLRSVLDMPLTVVRLVVPLGEIERRLGGALPSGRRDDLMVARRWLADGTGAGLEDFTVTNDRELGAVAAEVMQRAGFPAA